MRLKAAISFLFLFVTMTFAYVAGGQSSSASNTNGQDEGFEARRQNFKSGRNLLLDKGVPFEPEELLHDKWSKSLKDALNAMPEMHESRYEAAPLNGAYMADTLYLPENVQVSGHTVIVANYLVFEGKNPTIRGPYDISAVPSRIVVLGMSLAEALHKKGIVNVGFKATHGLPSFSLMHGFQQKIGHITIDASGPKPQTVKISDPKSKATLRIASWHELRPAVFQNQDTSGTSGTIGAAGTPGGTGANGISEPKALNGNCSSPATGSNDGVRGADGTGGKAGSSGGTGGQGGPGGNAGQILLSVQDGDLHLYNFKADGGQGGQGGEGGSGGVGGMGGQGGSGGDGVACGCSVGGGGGAGHGANGGAGGTGAVGGSGGIGGNGGSITVSLPAGSPGATASNSAGPGGLGGSGGIGGTGGLAANAGVPGIGATACSQTGSTGSTNFGGSSGTTGNSGNAGPNGALGQAGPAPMITVRSAPPPPPPPPCDPTDPSCCPQQLQITPGQVGAFTTPPVECPPEGCPCQSPKQSPIIIDTEGEGFALTAAAGGVLFDMTGDGHPNQIAWTAPGSHNAFLVLDRNGDGVISSGAEMFGNFTSQPSSAHPNGFLALAVYDDPANGGNGDGIIDARDQIFSKLRLWVDANHDGICQPGELHLLPDMGVYSISLDYSLSGRTDEYGNMFRYRAKINQGIQGNTSDVGKTAYDVFLVTR
ncbi:MAG TPA: hypothetical protein VGK24_18865 [Candidatus Angelobacter sp.]|jgi:hypothetical protein